MLREQRLDLEEQTAEEKRALDILRKELENLKKKTKAMEAHVKTALSELQVSACPPTTEFSSHQCPPSPPPFYIYRPSN